MKNPILPAILFLLLANALSSQPCYQRFFQEGKEAFDALEFEVAINNWKAARICSDMTREQEAELEDWIERAQSGYIDKLNDARKEAEDRAKEARRQARIAEANRLAFLANDEISQSLAS